MNALWSPQPTWHAVARTLSPAQGGPSHHVATAAVRGPGGIAIAVVEAPNDGILQLPQAEQLCHDFAHAVWQGAPGVSAELALQQGWQAIADRATGLTDEAAIATIWGADVGTMDHPPTVGGLVCAVLADTGDVAWLSIGDLGIYARQSRLGWYRAHAQVARMQKDRRERPDQPDPFQTPRRETHADIQGLAVYTSCFRNHANPSAYLTELPPLDSAVALDGVGHTLAQRCLEGQKRVQPIGDSAGLLLAIRTFAPPAIPLIQLRWLVPAALLAAVVIGALLGGRLLLTPLFPQAHPPPQTVTDQPTADLSAAVQASPAASTRPAPTPASLDLLPDCPVEPPPAATATAKPAEGAP